MVDAKIKIALVLIAITIFAAPIVIAQEVPAHVVISEVQIATNEFVELYNPTNSAIDMTGWHWCYFSSGRNWNNSWRDKTFPGGAIIQAHGFYLIGLKGFPGPPSDWQVYNSTQLADSGSVGIFPWDPDTKTAEEAKAGKIDAVGWGSVTYVYETATASTPGSGESIEREPLKDGYAPCQDTDNNYVDFVVQGTPAPKNSSSPEMDPAPVELFDAAGDLKGSFVNIQDAVDNASDGYTIRVDDGTYNENVDVDKQLTILSEHGAAVTTVNALYSNDHVFEVTADYVSISGFTVKGATGSGKAGISLSSNIHHCNISDNKASDSSHGIYLGKSCSYHTISSNTVSNNKWEGIELWVSSNNAITSNIAFNNTCGISLSSSSSNVISDNTASSNSYGICLSPSIGGPSSSDNMVTNNIASNNGEYGIVLYSSSENNISNNSALNNDYNGIALYSSSDNTLTNNIASNNNGYGINLDDSNNNLIYNNYFDNTNNAWDDGNNLWNIAKIAGTNIIGGSWLGGNYWSDYVGIDTNGDGLGDTMLPYNSNGNILISGDKHPLVPAGIAPLLSIEKSDNPDSVQPGGTLNYFINLSNTGYMNATNAIVTETYDDNVTFVSAIPAPSEGDDTWIFPALNANETKWINISVTVNPSTPIGTILHNIVIVTCDEGVTDSDTEVTTVLSGEPNCTCGDICVITTGWWLDGGAFNPSDSPIQDAIDNAITGDTICVKDGEYKENVDVHKRLTIRSENGAASTIVNASYLKDHVFEVTADYVSISGFTVKGATGSLKAGIYLDSNIDHCNISDNKASDNSNGIYLPESSNYNSISSNIAVNNGNGICISSSSGNKIYNNTASSNGYSIRLYSSSGNTISDCTISSNSYGIYLEFSSGNMITNNTASNNGGYGIRLYSSSNNTISSNIVFNNNKGISLSSSSSNRITNNTASNNNYGGICLRGSSDNKIANNTASSNNYGIRLDDSNNNLIYNNYFNNTNNAWDDGNNVWNIAKTAGTNIIDGSWLGGNYWSDYDGIDANGDGLGDTLLPYNSNGDILIGGDMHPLVTVGYAHLLSIEKSDNPDPIQPGGRLNYSILVNNVGYIATTNVRVIETYDVSVTYESAIPVPSEGNGTWIFPSVNANETRRINISVTVKPSTPIGTVLYNIVNVTCDEGVTDSDTEATTVFSREHNCTCGDICVITTGWWRDGGAFNPSDTPIQDAIDNAGAGDTICVKDGEYNENVDVDKRLAIKSENGAASTTVNALYSKDNIFEVTSDYVSILGFTVKGATGLKKAGILGCHIDHCNISDNKASDNFCGIYLWDSSNYNSITNNSVSNNEWYGIYMSYSSNNNLIYNNYFNNTNNANDDGNNIWNVTKTAGTNIIGGSWLGGNYWSDYGGVDLNGDGLGDTLLPYNSGGEITTGGDWHPLVPAGIAPPNITSFSPPSPVNNTVCTWRTFNVTVNQTVNVSWYLNNTLQQTNESVTEASCTLHANVSGEHNVTAVARNPNGTAMQTWVWNVTEESSHTFECSAGWNMISFPVDPLDKNADTIFGPEYYYLCTRDPDTGGYVPVDAVETEIGYWLLVLEDRSVTVLGTQLSEYNTDITQGWNMIGSIWEQTNVPDGTETVPADKLYPHLYTWCGDHYVLTQDIGPGLGYWALAYVDCELHVFPAPSAAPLPVQQITWADNDWRVRLAITSGAGTDVAEFGLHEDATYDFSAELDVPEPPSPPPSSTSRYQQVYFYNPENPLVKKLSTCYIPHYFDDDGEEYNSWLFSVDYSGDASYVTVTWNAKDINAVPAEYSLLFIADGEQIDMRTTPSYTFRAKTRTYEFEIRAITGGKKPDLVIEEEYENYGGQAGSYTVFFVVKNIGTATAPEGHYVTLYVDGVEKDKKLVSTDLEPGETYKGSFKTKVGLTGKVENIKVCADSYNDVDELDEGNNCLKGRWQRVEKPTTDKPPMGKPPTDKPPKEKGAGLSD